MVYMHKLHLRVPPRVLHFSAIHLIRECFAKTSSHKEMLSLSRIHCFDHHKYKFFEEVKHCHKQMPVL